jgi:excisionase family DNA binding protein
MDNAQTWMGNDRSPKTSPPEPRLAYTIPRTAELASISRSQVYVEIQAGRLIAIKVGGRTLVLRDDLISWLKSRPRKA